MKRSITIGALVALMVTMLPVANAAGSSHCPTISGKAKLDFGGSRTGTAKVTLDGEKLKVDFTETGFVSTGSNTADVYFTWHFPGGDVDLVEHSTYSSLSGPRRSFASTVDVEGGGSGAMTWSGVANDASGRAVFTLDGTLCVGP
jgi:hypothetical protein